MSDKIIFTFFGDIMLGELFEYYQRGVKSKIIETGINPFEFCQEEFIGSDFNVGNLECVLSDTSNLDKPFSEFMRAPKKFVSFLTDNHINIVNLANNHTFDHGASAFTDMVDVLHSNNINTFGYDKDTKIQTEPLVVEKKNLKIGFLGYYLKTSFSDDQMSEHERIILKSIKRAKKKSNFLILSLHWGYEYANLLPSKLLVMGKNFLDAGADILFGHHPHRLHGAVKYNGKVFAPSLGNFIFTDFLPANRETALLKVDFEISNHEINYELIPLTINKNFQPIPSPDLMHKIQRRSYMLKNVLLNPVEVKKRDRAVCRASQFGHVVNRIKIRILFILHLFKYRPFVFKIFRNKLLK